MVLPRLKPGSAKRLFAFLLPILLVLGGVGYLVFLRPGASPAGHGMGGRPQAVSVAEVKTADMPIWISALATAVPRNLVTVRSRVDGQLMSIRFREGQTVKAGELLAEIDPRAFQVQVMQAEGSLAKDTALLQNAQADLARYQELWAKDSIAKQQLDTQESLVRQYQGAVATDRGSLANAKLQLEYSRVTAPAPGRVGLRQVDPGNQVHASDTAGIVVIAQTQPMTLVFAVPEANLPALGRRLAAKEPVVVEAWDRGQKNRLAVGRLLTIDNLVDTATGTVKLKAEFANQDNSLFPNQFINARLLLGTQEGATVVPGAALLRGAKGAFVYTVDAEGTVSAVTVKPGPEDGGLVAVEGELKPGSRVVTDGADKLRDGIKVEVITAEARAKQAQAAQQGNGQRKPRRPPGDRAAGPEGAPPLPPN